MVTIKNMFHIGEGLYVCTIVKCTDKHMDCGNFEAKYLSNIYSERHFVVNMSEVCSNGFLCLSFGMKVSPPTFLKF